MRCEVEVNVGCSREVETRRQCLAKGALDGGCVWDSTCCWGRGTGWSRSRRGSWEKSESEGPVLKPWLSNVMKQKSSNVRDEKSGS